MQPTQQSQELLRAALQLHRAGDLPGAEALYRQLLAADPTLADGWNMLAQALRARGALDEAQQAADRAIALRPRIAPYWFTLGGNLAAQGEAVRAESAFRRAVELEPSFAEAFYALGRSLARRGRADEALPALRQALRFAPKVAEIHYELAAALAGAGRPADALTAYADAFRLDPEWRLDRAPCFDLFIPASFKSLPAFWHGELTRFLAREGVDRAAWAPAAAHVLLVTSHVSTLCAAPPGAPLEPAALEALTRDELFGLALRHTVIAHLSLERMLTRVRARLLQDEALRARTPLRFLCDLALQCFNTEYVYAETEAEARTVATLLARASGARDWAVIAMYRPLAGLAGVPRTAPAEPEFAALHARLVDEPMQERALRDALPSLGITDPVSRRVQAMYEENPYPRWMEFVPRPAVAAAEWVRRDLVGSHAPALAAAPRVLVAGCGTGWETLQIAAEIAGARVTAIDLSRASLAYAKRMAQRHGLDGIEFVHGDLTSLEALQGPFDLIFSVGVLHHLARPAQGLASLVRLGRPGTLFKLGLYSRAARGAVYAARRFVSEQRWAASPAGIRTFRQLVMDSPESSPLRGLTQFRDFFTTSECRDLVFHVQEHGYALPELREFFESAGLRPLGFAGPILPTALASYRAKYPDDAAIADFSRWLEIERDEPAAFREMYRVWCVA